MTGDGLGIIRRHNLALETRASENTAISKCIVQRPMNVIG